MNDVPRDLNLVGFEATLGGYSGPPLPIWVNAAQVVHVRGYGKDADRSVIVMTQGPDIFLPCPPEEVIRRLRGEG